VGKRRDRLGSAFSWYRHELSDHEWSLLEPLLPERGGGRPFADHRRMLNGLFWWLETGAPWRDIPERYGSWKSLYTRFSRWRRNGMWSRILSMLHAELDCSGRIDWTHFSVDATNVRAHKAAAGARKNITLRDEPVDHALGYSCGGFGSKLHLVSDGHGLPLAAVVSAGQAHESRFVTAVLNAVRVPREGRGRPRQRPHEVVGDRGYSHSHVRRWLRTHRMRAVIPERRDQAAHRRGRPLLFDREDGMLSSAVWAGSRRPAASPPVWKNSPCSSLPPSSSR
jgi:transposase